MRVAPLIKITIAAFALGTLGACATPFRADVSRFQQLPAPQGQSFAIVARDADDRGGIEFGQYASLVAAELTRVGYRPAAAGDRPDLTVKLSYGVDNGRERVVSDPGFGGFGGGYYGGFGGYGRGFGYGGYFGRPVIIRSRHGYRYVGGFYDPFLFGSIGGYGGGYGGVSSYTVYTSGLDLIIERTATGERLFEGSAEAQSRDNNLTRLVPNLIEAMFTDFPGNSGETMRITIAPDDRRSSRR